MVNVDALPADLTTLDQWGNADTRKIPHNPMTGRRADTTDLTTCGTFAAAVNRARRDSRLPYVCFVFAKDGRLVGIDLDHCRDPETGEIEPWAWAIVRQLNSYTEISLSGTGLHIIVAGTLPLGGRKRGQVEMYGEGRHFVMTGNVLPGFETIAERTDELAALHRETFPPPPRSVNPVAPLSLETDELRRRCEGSSTFRALNAGDMSDYRDESPDGVNHSSADLAFCNIVARNGGTREQADELMRASGIYRPEKWDSRRGAKTYGDITLDRAFDGTVQVFMPRSSGPKPQDAVDPLPTLAATGTDDPLPDDVPTLKAMIVDLTRRLDRAEQRAERADARATEAERKVAMLSRVQSRTTGIIRNNKLGQERFTAVALTNMFAHRESAGIQLEGEKDDGLYKISLIQVAEAGGASEDTAGKHIRKLEAEGTLRREVRWVAEEWVHPETGELMSGRNRQFIGPADGSVIDFVEAVARLTPQKEKNWGGLRRCSQHPNAEVIRTTTWTCAECGEELRTVQSKPYRPKPQDAADPPTTDDILIAEDDAEHRDSIPQRGPSLKGRKRATCYNEEMTVADGTVGAAWLSGASLPGMEPRGPDRWGTEPHAGAAP